MHILVEMIRRKFYFCCVLLLFMGSIAMTLNVHLPNCQMFTCQTAKCSLAKLPNVYMPNYPSRHPIMLPPTQHKCVVLYKFIMHIITCIVLIAKVDKMRIFRKWEVDIFRQLSVYRCFVMQMLNFSFRFQPVAMWSALFCIVFSCLILVVDALGVET